MQMSDEQAARILTVGAAVDFVLANDPAAGSSPSTPSCEGDRCCWPTCWRSCRRIWRARCSRTRPGASGAGIPIRVWPSWATACSSLAVTTYLYPRLEAERFGAGQAHEDPRAGRLGASRAERWPSGWSCRAPARGGAGGRARERRGTGRDRAGAGLGDRGGDRRLYLHAGYERTAEAVVEAFAPEIEDALANPVDFKSALQELLARRGAEVAYEVTAEDGSAARARLLGRRRGRGPRARAAAPAGARSTPSRRPREWPSTGWRASERADGGESCV